MKINREVLKSNFPQVESSETEQGKGLPQPPLQKPYSEEASIIDLPPVDGEVIQNGDIYSCFKERRSLRKYTEDSMSLKELAYLLWATQGVDKVVGKRNFATFRPVPSGGARHAFETYLAINRVEGLEKGIYRYLHKDHQLVLVQSGDFLDKVAAAAEEQKFIANAAVVFIWSCFPARCEWRYSVAAPKLILLDAGHVCQNLYLSCQSIGWGTCAVASYDQEKMDELIQVDGQEEFTVYLAPVGKKQ